MKRKKELTQKELEVQRLLRYAKHNGKDANLLEAVMHRIRISSGLVRDALQMEYVRYLTTPDHMNRSKI